jgi:hypothetical protein
MDVNGGIAPSARIKDSQPSQARTCTWLRSCHTPGSRSQEIETLVSWTRSP